MVYDIVIKGGRLLGRDLDLVADLAIAGGSIAALGADLDGREIIEASGKYVLPGAIDGHIHLRTEWAGDPDLLYADTFESGTIAAAFGGVTTIVDQVHVPAGMPLKEGLAQRLRDAEGHSVIDFGEHINLREASRERAAEIPALAELGCPTFKLFMASDGYELPDNIIYLAMQHIAEIGGVALVHAENASMSRELKYAKGWEGGQYAGARPGLIEGEAANRALVLAELAGARVLIVHNSAAEAVHVIEGGKMRRGRDAVLGEVCINHHLLLGEEIRNHPLRPFAFPVREERDRLAMWDAIANGVIDVASTDHGPYKRDASGAIGVQSISAVELRVALLHTFGVLSEKLSLSRWVDLCSARPAEVYGLSSKGSLVPGKDADVVVFDPQLEVQVKQEELHSSLDYSTYEGLRLRGYPIMTMCRGRVVTEGSKLLGEHDWGHFVKRDCKLS